MKKLVSFLAILAIFLVACSDAQLPTPAPATATTGATLILPTATSILFSPVPTPRATPPVVFSQGVIAYYSDRDGNSEIYLASPDGSNLRRLTNDPAEDDSPAISPDGSQIVFLTSRHDPAPSFPFFKYEIYVMNIDGTDQRRLTTTDAAEDHPAWSPDGKKILFDSDYDGDGKSEIYTMNVDGSQVTRLTSGQANDQFADWSPDGGQIAFTSDRNGNYDLYIMDVDGGNQRQLTSAPVWEMFPAWSPDGAQIAYFACDPQGRPQRQDIYVMNADGSNVRRLTQTPSVVDEDPAWSPDGKQIVFQSDRGGKFEIYVMDADGGNQRRLADQQGDNYWPSWGKAVLPSAATEMLPALQPITLENADRVELLKTLEIPGYVRMGR
jgi:TolB protein